MSQNHGELDLIAESASGASVGEAPPPGEAAALKTILQMVEAKVRAAAKNGPAHRDAHPKAHGCVRAEFRILDDLPPALRVGVFAQPRTYQAWIRFSNSAEQPQEDSVSDGRGMAVKLMGVEGSRSTTQDFIMVNYPAFFVRTAADYIDLQSASSPLKFFFPGFNPFHFRLHEFFVARRITNQTVTNPLDIRYWSMTPYLFGDRAYKFSAKPRSPASPFSSTSAPNFLRENLIKHLAERGAEFDFMAQFREKPAAMPIEDPTIEWSEDDAPFVPVARIFIPPQSFATPEQDAFCENLSFTPWHGLDAHRPLGGANRVRRAVYEAVSRLRHELNGAERREPTET